MVGNGTHEALLGSNELYARLVERQLAPADEANRVRELLDQRRAQLAEHGGAEKASVGEGAGEQKQEGGDRDTMPQTVQSEEKPNDQD